MNKLGPSFRPKTLKPYKGIGDWYYYETKNCIFVCMWCDGKYSDVKIPWSKLMKSAKRCGKI